MWITSDVKLPQAILEAQSAGRLVFFVGAGASIDAPSDLPLFGDLARQLADLARVPYDKDAPIDYFLGSMPKSFDAHRHARDIIARETSLPNKTHTAVIRLASAVGKARIVTTNFDDHLAKAALAREIRISDVWIGPALPLGEEFTGIVHLHGSVLREPRELVLTDGDFGRAYLTHAWATRFLLPMFQNFTVLFIGYSHDDPLMRYLALGLPSGTPRYAFTNEDETSHSKWERLGIQTIGYPVSGHNHLALVDALEAWDIRVRMGQTEHRTRMTEILSGGPTLTPVDHDYLVDRIETLDGAREFSHVAASLEPALQVAWLKWAEELPGFKALFSGQESDAGAAALANWFCQNFIADPELHGAALQTVERLGQTLDDGLYRAAAWAAEELTKADFEAGRRWKAFLATSVHGQSAPPSMETLLPYAPNERAEDRSVLRAALRCYLVLKRHWFASDGDDLKAIPDAEVRWNADADSLTVHIKMAVDAARPGDSSLGTVLEDSLSAAYDLLAAYHGDKGWDGLNFGRSAIEPHEQDQFRDPIDAIIDGLRDYGEKALVVRPDLPERWWSLGQSLFHRLGLHLLTADTSRTADEKIGWLLDRAALYETDLKHEVYQVLKISTANASSKARAALLAAAQVGPGFPEETPDLDRHTAYATYNLLVWLAQVAPGWADIDLALAAMQNENPGFAPRENPDFDHWMTSGTWGGKLPYDPEDFIAAFEADPSGAAADLLDRDYTERNFEQPEWSDALSLLRRVAESRPDLGERLWALVELRADDDHKASVFRAIVEGWAKSDLGAGATKVLARVESEATHRESARAVSRFLVGQARTQIESSDTEMHAAMRRIAENLWALHAQAFVHSEDFDPGSFAPLFLNSWPGDLVQFWMIEVDRRWRKHRDDWSGLNDQERGALSSLLSGPRHALDATQPAVARYLYFLFAADASFATKHVMPLFRRDSTAALVWSSFLHSPRHNDKMLAAGLLDSTIKEWDRLDSLGGRSLLNQFFGLVFSIVSFAGISTESRRDLLDQSVLAEGGRHASDFAHAVARILRGEKIDGSEVWKRWLRDHLQARLNGVPRTAEAEELTCWADVVPYIGKGIGEAVELLGGHSIGLGNRFMKPDFDTVALRNEGPAIVSHFAERVRNSTPGGYLIIHQVEELVNSLTAALGEATVQPLVHEAIERGFIAQRGNDS